MRKTVYISGPYSSDPDGSVARALAAADMVWAMGGAPIVPHLMHYWDKASKGKTYDDFMEISLSMVSRSEAVYRTPGKSAGADKETALAESLGIPVFAWTTEGALHEFLEEKGPRRAA